VKKGDEEYILLGEAKSRVSKKEIDRFIRKCEKNFKGSNKNSYLLCFFSRNKKICT
jgi:hypothetical protein